jgi:hypothetical protein
MATLQFSSQILDLDALNIVDIGNSPQPHTSAPRDAMVATRLQKRIRVQCHVQLLENLVGVTTHSTEEQAYNR